MTTSTQQQKADQVLTTCLICPGATFKEWSALQWSLAFIPMEEKK